MSENAKANGAAGMATPVDDIESVPVDTGPPPDPETVSQMISIRLTAGMIDRFKAAAKLHGVSHYQTLVKHVLRCWIDENQPIDAPRVPTPEETPRPVRSRKELIAALREAVKHQEDALARGAGKDELQALQEAIDGIKDDLADLENVGDF